MKNYMTSPSINHGHSRLNLKPTSSDVILSCRNSTTKHKSHSIHYPT